MGWQLNWANKALVPREYDSISHLGVLMLAVRFHLTPGSFDVGCTIPSHTWEF
ncbi:uncharacterized protein PHALS_09939 [Plasmopara halstedii]|uniref:Uncharacterized protein n=1 Tax=Plasmopara halstedii TaxID=4781 RepID=A0A0P1AFT3_PLAHL|nr:uncharacterized protein PHALS_09939 [Plasmopara halstedii]CEG39703.1 hypothetical protein PHALS_09939 [Plasmopara halstedii]|eukprot:XP_024576072.1 hypothetical protein PHALS_09939 [Plasmopara halstedii]